MTQSNNSSDSRTLSQDEYIPTEFENASWPFIGDPPSGANFAPSHIAVVDRYAPGADEMFPNFGGQTEVLPNGKYLAASRKEREAAARSLLVEPEVETVTFVKAEFEAEQAKLLEEAFVQGQESAKAEIDDKHLHYVATVNHIVTSVRKEIAESFREVEVASLELMLLLAERILSLVVEINPLAITGIVREALGNVFGGTVYRVFIPSAHFALIAELGGDAELPDDLRGLEFLPDDSLTIGCRVETSGGVIEIELDQALKQIRASLIE